MATVLTLGCLALALIGLSITVVQSVSLRRQLGELPPVAPALPGVSILKPLCGLDDELAQNLAAFAALDYPDFEVLLGLASTRDAAFPLARAAALRWPDRFRVVLQRGEPGLNPKVNQLVTLAAAARHDIVAVSDSNVRVEPGYLEEVAALLADPAVGLVTHPIRGEGAHALGSRLDALHLAAGVSAGTVAAARLAGKTLVVGKSMALRKKDLAALGGFAAYADVLAEDWAMGVAVAKELGKRVAIGHRPIANVSVDRPLGHFVKRYRRWAVLQRKSVGTPLYLCQLLLHVCFFALLGAALTPAAWSLAAATGLWLAKVFVDGRSLEALTGESPSALDLALLPVKDLALLGCFFAGLVESTVDWRGHRLHVLPGTGLRRPQEDPREEAATAA